MQLYYVLYFFHVTMNKKYGTYVVLMLLAYNLPSYDL